MALIDRAARIIQQAAASRRSLPPANAITATTPGTETFIDLIAPRVDTITLNGRPLDPASHFDGVRVRLPGLEADNVLTIAAHCAFMTTG